MNKKNLILAGAFVLVFIAGVASMRVWDAYRAASAPQFADVADSDSLLIVNMDEASEPEGVVAVSEPEYVDDSTVPSQLSKIKVQGLKRVISRSGASIDAPQDDGDSSPVVLGDVDRTAVPAGTAQPTKLPSDSKISMIEAPVQVRLIKTLNDYKAFKRTARGKYPEADFTKDYIVVLESTSNLPDKVFEIQDVVEDNGKMQVIYRVNIFGLDQKTNTHSAVRIDKRDLPVELKQVL
ncbi:hypothetical protein [Candidatus Avelusimicrobium alvi]|uniref:hypothetical protein n=1 Tax=Candidatus Avelusimicrobium alvi TaxID=3416221 RepID=UPI003D0B5A1A